MNPLYKETFGSGPDLVMVHGWNMHSGIWREFAEQLAEHHRVTLIDLPGHGNSPMIEDYSVDGISRALLASAPPQADWIGWSMGAMLLIYLTDRWPERVRRVVLLAGNAQFVRSDDWRSGMAPRLLDQMADNLAHNHDDAVMRFMTLQVAGVVGSRKQLKILLKRMNERPATNSDALNAGLAMLRTTDMRVEFARMGAPTQLLLGRRDTLIPVSCGAAMATLRPATALQIIEGAGHMPFISHPEESLACVCRFLAD